MHSNNKLHSFEMANYIIWRKRVGKLGTHNTYCITRKEITMVINLHVITSVFIFVGQIGSKWESCFCCYVKICLTNYSTFPCFSPLTLSNCAFLLFANLNRVFIIVLKLKVANKNVLYSNELCEIHIYSSGSFLNEAASSQGERLWLPNRIMYIGYDAFSL